MFNEIQKAWQNEMAMINKMPWMEKLRTGDFSVANYKGFLLETYHHAGINPQIQAYATMFFKGNPREIVRMFLKHATSEIAHDLLALNDLVAMGEDQERILKTRPLPSTIAFNAFVLMQIQFSSPLSYLGYLFHLEFLPTQQGDRHIEELKKIGVPASALTFLEEHATVDQAHNKLMEKYVSALVTNQSELDEVIYSTKTSAHLHYKMLADAFENGPKFFGK